MKIATEASVVDAMTPNVGTLVCDNRLNRSGKSPSLAAARGISALIIVHAVRAPKPEMMTMTLMRLPAQVPPNIAFTASPYGAVDSASFDEGRMPKTAVRDMR